MEFVDRIEEMARLKAALNRTTPSFVAIYGRRRVGKSALIQRVLGDGDIYYLATEVDAACSASWWRKRRHPFSKDWTSYPITIGNPCCLPLILG